MTIISHYARSIAPVIPEVSSKKPKLRLWVVEGPAGSGKSTLIKHLIETTAADIGPQELAIDLPRPRDYGATGAQVSQLRDHARIIQLVSIFEYTKDLPLRAVEPIVIDRWLLSQWVYGTIRKTYPVTADLAETLCLLVTRGLFTLESSLCEYVSRGGLGPDSDALYPIVELEFLLVHPNIVELKKRRDSNPSRQYPFDYLTEHALYTIVRDSLPMLFLRLLEKGLFPEWTLGITCITEETALSELLTVLERQV